MAFNAWTPQGTVINNCGNPSVIYEGNPQILSGSVFKAWYSSYGGGHFNFNYAESSDGTAFTPYSGNPIRTSNTNPFPRVWKNPNTGMYWASITTDSGISIYTSPDGVTWALGKANAIVLDQAWESGGAVGVGQLNVVEIDADGIWWGYYTAGGSSDTWYMGQATSTDGLNWTKNPENPIIKYPTSNFEWHKINGKIYGWSQGFDITPGYSSAFDDTSPVFRFSGSNPAGPFTPDTVPTYYATTAAEFVGNLHGELCDPSVCEANGNCYLYYTKTASGTAYAINCAIAEGVTLAQLVTGYEGVVNVPFSQVPIANNPNLENLVTNPTTIANWTKFITLSGWDTIQINSGIFSPATGGKNASAYYNAITWGDDQWASMTVGECSGVIEVATVLRANSGTGNAYLFGWYGTFGSSGTLLIQEYRGGAYYNNLATNISWTLEAGDTLTAVAIGTHLYLYCNGFLVYNVTDSYLGGGNAGLFLSPNTTATSWSGGGLQAAPDNGIQGALGAGGASATVAWTGDSTGNVTADGSGNYNTGEALLPFGDYTITPSKTGYTFSPTSASETVSGADITGVNFTATQTLVATPTFSPVAGTYTSTQNVIISSTDSALAGFAMYYTTDGSTPTTGATLYVAPVSISVTSTLKAIAVATGYANSAVGSAAYVINLTPLHYSVPDDRNYGNFPNLPVNVQGTLTYTTPSVYSLRYWFDTLFGRTQSLPLDSRISKPTDSRVAGTTPQNSRTPGTFGPGE